MKKVKFYVLFAVVLVLILINSVYYITTRNTLIQNQQREIELITNSINTSIDTSKKAERFFGQLVARELRLASIAIKEELPPDIKDVDNEQLKELATKYGLMGIDLWVRKGHDVVIEKSSDPQAIGMGSIDWDDKKWYKMFVQLFEKQDVDYIEGFGQELKNFWSGPIDTRMVDQETVTKWGYYHDGTTNYIIDPYVEDELISSFLKSAGVDNVIDKLVKESPSLLEVSVLNSEALKTGEKRMKDFDVVWYSDRLISYGTYKYEHPTDTKKVEQAFQESEEKSHVVTINDKSILKTYIPTTYVSGQNLNHQLTIVISTDYDLLKKTLVHKTQQILLISFFCLVIGLIVILMVLRAIQKKEDTIQNVQSMYSNNIESLFKSIKEHRHDFNHHIFTILGMTNMKMYEELHEYVKNLAHIQQEFDDIIQVNIPAFSGLLQAKIAQAIEKKIVFEHHFENFEKLSLNLKKTTELVRVIGNILDNAFNAVLDSDKDNKRVTIKGSYRAGKLTFYVFNNGIPIPKEELSKIFEHGFTTREDRGGSGIGLSSCKKIINAYKGKLEVKSGEDGTLFKIELPVAQSELTVSHNNHQKSRMTL